MKSLREFGFRLLSAPYELVFKEPMGVEALRLFVGTSYVAIGTLFGALLTFTFYVVGARTLGPESFGNLGLITTASGILALSMGFGFTPMVKYASGTLDEGARANIISTAYLQVALFTAASVAAYALLSPQLSAILGIPVTIYTFGLTYAVTITFFTLTMNSLRIFFKMKTYAICAAIQSAIALGAFLIFVGKNAASWQTAAYAIFLSNTVIGIVLLVYLRTHLRFRYDRLWSKKILGYVRFSAPGAIAAAFMGIDRLLINGFETTASVGIYNAYFLSSLTIALLIWNIFNAAFFPYASKSNDRPTILRSVNKAMPYITIALIPFIVVLQRIVFILYGSRYAFSWEIALIFALAASALVLYLAYSWLMASVGPQGAKVNTLSSIIALIVLIGFDVVLIPLIGILGAAITLFFAYFIPILFLFSKRHVLQPGSKITQPTAQRR